MDTPNKTARFAGLFYFVYIGVSILADQFGQFIFADAASTIIHIQAHETSFRLGIVLSLYSIVLFLLAAWELYVLLKPVNDNLALLFLILNLGGFVVWCLSLLPVYASLLLLSGGESLRAFLPEQLRELAMVLINMRKSGAVIAQVPYGVWLLPLGYLVYKSGFLPKILGVLLIADFVAEMIYVLQRFLLPQYAALATPCWAVSFIAEAGLALWLLVMGVKVRKPILASAQE